MRDTVGFAFSPSGLTFGGVHKYSQAADILTTSFVALGIDKSMWHASLRNKTAAELWMKSSVIITLSQNSAGTQGLISFAADTWFRLPCEGIFTAGYYIKGGNNTNTTEYFFTES